ncbi:MAG TPA: ABC transporter permease [Geodermatophilus sp.]|nr:ABC transporter permease [Geodermatophilus sp.]
MNGLRERVAGAVASGAVVWLVVAVLAAVAAFGADDFATAANLTNLARQAVVLMLVALGQFLVVLTGGVDLSIGANVRLTAILAAMVMGGADSRFLPGVAVALAVGTFVGLVNGVIVAVLRMEAFIATLATQALLAGTALYIAATPQGRSAPLLDRLYGATLPGGVYVITALALVIWFAAAFALHRTPWGRHVYATGGDQEVAALSGVRTTAVGLSVFVLAGLLGGVAGVLTLAGSGVGDPNAAAGLEFTALAIVVIGGASLAGGRGRLLGVFGGVVLFALLGNVFNLLRVDVWYQQGIRGLVILIAAAAYVQRRRAPARRPGPAGAPLPATT